MAQDAITRDVQRLRDLALHRRRGRGRQRQHGRAAQRAAGVAQRTEGGPEVVAPLRDAVRLVDDEQPDALFLQQPERAQVGQALGRREHDAHGAARQQRLVLEAAVGVQRRVQLHGRHAALRQRVALILHQRDQRRDDDGERVAQHGRQLVAQRLAGPGGHDGQRAAAGQHARDDLGLARAQFAQAEHAPQHAAQPDRRDRFARRQFLGHGLGRRPGRVLARAVQRKGCAHVAALRRQPSTPVTWFSTSGAQPMPMWLACTSMSRASGQRRACVQASHATTPSRRL